MTNCIELPPPAPPASLEQKWGAYIEAKQLADCTRRIEDGIAAGRAWRAFLAEFDPKSEAASILSFPVRAR